MLTLKQSRFITAYIQNGGNGRVAAEKAGYKGNAQTLRQVAYENLRKHDVRQALVLPLQQEERVQDRVVSELKGMAFAPLQEEVNAGAKLKSLEILAKIHQMYDDAPKVQVNVGLLTDVRLMSEEELLLQIEQIRSSC